MQKENRKNNIAILSLISLIALLTMLPFDAYSFCRKCKIFNKLHTVSESKAEQIFFNKIYEDGKREFYKNNCKKQYFYWSSFFNYKKKKYRVAIEDLNEILDGSAGILSEDIKILFANIILDSIYNKKTFVHFLYKNNAPIFNSVAKHQLDSTNFELLKPQFEISEVDSLMLEHMSVTSNFEKAHSTMNSYFASPKIIEKALKVDSIFFTNSCTTISFLIDSSLPNDSTNIDMIVEKYKNFSFAISALLKQLKEEENFNLKSAKITSFVNYNKLLGLKYNGNIGQILEQDISIDGKEIPMTIPSNGSLDMIKLQTIKSLAFVKFLQLKDFETQILMKTNDTKYFNKLCLSLEFYVNQN